MNDQCRQCGELYDLRQECESTGYCDLCAQTLLQDFLNNAPPNAPKPYVGSCGLRGGRINIMTIDLIYKKQSKWFHKILLLAFRNHFNHFAKTVLVRSFERSLVSSKVMHEQCGIVDKMLWPERWRDSDK